MTTAPPTAGNEARAKRSAASAVAAANVRAEAARRNLHSHDLAPYLDIKPQQVLRKMRGEALFTVDELEILATEVFKMAGSWELLRDQSNSVLLAIA